MTSQLESNDNEVEMAILGVYAGDRVGVKFIKAWYSADSSIRLETLDAWILLLEQLRSQTAYEAELMK